METASILDKSGQIQVKIVVGKSVSANSCIKSEKSRKAVWGDSVFSLVILAPLVVGYWRATWTIMDMYQNSFPGVSTYFLGGLVMCFFTIVRSDSLDKQQSPQYCNFIYRRCYTYVFSVNCIMFWRGGWIILDDLNLRFGADTNRPYYTIAIAVLGLSLLVLTKSIRNISAPPFLIAVDMCNTTFTYPTRFNVS